MNISDVFISYRRKDIEFVKKLSAAFTDQQREVWVDWEDIPPGASDFTREIGMGIEGANVFIVVLSPNYLESEFCLQELNYADELNKRIIPIVYRPVDASHVPESIRSINWVYFTTHAGQTNEFSAAFRAVSQAIDTDYDYVREHTRLLTRARDWENNEKNPSFFLSGAELDAAERWLSTASNLSPHATDIQTDYILQSRQWQTRRQRRLLSGALALLALAVIGLIVAVVAGVEARQQQLIAERNAAETLSLAAANVAAETVANGEYLDGLRLAHFASTFIDNPPAQARQTLRQIAFQPGTRYAFFGDLPSEMNALGLKPGESARSSDQSGTTLVANDEEVFTIQDADGQMLMRLNRLIGPPFLGYGFINENIHPAVIQQYENPLLSIQAMDIMPDMTYVAVGRESGLVIVENAQSVSEVWRPEGHTLPVDGVRFSEDGRYLVSRGSSDTLNDMSVIDREFIIWETTFWQPVLHLNDFGPRRDLVAVSEDGLHLLFLEQSPPGYTLWDVRDSRQVWTLRDGMPVMEASFSPDGESIVVSSLLTMRMRPPRNFMIYDMDGNPIAGFGGEPGEDVIDMPLLFSPDGTTLRTIKADGRLIEIDIQSGEEMVGGGVPQTNVIGGSANGQYIALQDFENSMVIVWDIDAAESVGRFDDEDLGFSMTISNDGRYVAYSARNAAFEDAGLVIRDLADDALLAVRFDEFAVGSGVTGSISFAFGPGSEILLYADRLGNVRVVETGVWRETLILRGLSDVVSDMVMSADRHLVAAAGESGTVMIWDAASGAALQRIDGAGAVAKVGFSPDGGSIVTGDERGQVSLWQLTGSEDMLSWVSQNRALLPVTCDDLLQASIIATQDSCPIVN